jgi:hypothetical protein
MKSSIDGCSSVFIGCAHFIGLFMPGPELSVNQLAPGEIAALQSVDHDFRGSQVGGQRDVVPVAQ